MSHEPKVVIARDAFPDVHLEQEHARGRAIVELASVATPGELGDATRFAHGLIVTNQPLSKAHFRKLGKGMKVIGRAGIGLDAIDLQAAREHGIAVLNLPNYATAEVATHAVALMLSLHRRLSFFDSIARTSWTGWQEHIHIRSLRELTLGLVGCGMIGTAVVERARALVGRILAFDPFRDDFPAGAERVSTLLELLRFSDIISLHLPLNDSTRGLIGREEFKQMRRDAILINVSRGPLIDESGLAEALETGAIAGAGLDVLTTEPPALDAPLLRAPRTIITPHVAWYSESSERRVRTQALDDVLTALEGQPLRHGRYAVPPPTHNSRGEGHERT